MAKEGLFKRRRWHEQSNDPCYNAQCQGMGTKKIDKISLSIRDAFPSVGWRPNEMQFEQSSDIAHVVSTPEVHRARALVAAAAVGVNNIVL